MKIDQEQIDRIFASSGDQREVLLELYKLLYDGSAEDRPKWETIKKVEGWPTMGLAVSKYVWDKFKQFDRIHHPEVMAGGRWMNNGWATDDDMDDWTVEPAPVTLQRTMKGDENVSKM